MPTELKPDEPREADAKRLLAAVQHEIALTVTEVVENRIAALKAHATMAEERGALPERDRFELRANEAGRVLRRIVARLGP